MKTFAPDFAVRGHRGFSLAELLMTIAVLGIMCSLAMPLFGGQHEAFLSIKAKRNAQELVTECAAAQAGGVNFVVAGDLEATLVNLKAGAVAGSGMFKGREYGMKGMSVEEIGYSKGLLAVQAGTLVMK
jgi:prepilin-type N-terminal cleavage/methylation domain-containing protein